MMSSVFCFLCQYISVILSYCLLFRIIILSSIQAIFFKYVINLACLSISLIPRTIRGVSEEDQPLGNS